MIFLYKKDKVQQDSNKKIENERPKASGTLKVENNLQQ